MRPLHLRRSVFAVTLLTLASCDNDEGPTLPEIGLPDALPAVSVSVAKNTTAEATVAVSSIDGRTLAFSVVSGPANGTVELTPLPIGVRIRFTPTPGFAGVDQVTYRVDDGVSTADGVVNIMITNAAPSAASVVFRRPALRPFTFQVSGSDPDDDALTFEVVDGPSNGTLSGFSAAVPAAGPQAAEATTTAQVTYTPDAGFTGDETFTYRAHDGNDPSPPATVALNANRLPALEVEGETPVMVRRNMAVLVSLDVSDADRDDVTTTVGAGPGHGTLGDLETTLSGYQIIYTPEPGYTGDDVFTVLLDDGFDGVSADIDLTVVNEAPRAFNVSQFGFVGSEVVVLLSGSDPDDDPLTFEIVAGPAEGTLGVVTSTGPNTAEVLYSPGAAGAGPQSFTFRVGDGLSFSPPATATVVLRTEAPIAEDVNVSTVENTPVDITLTAIDQQGDALTFTIASPPSNGTLGPITLLGPFTALVTYTPGTDYTGADLFKFTASDGTSTSNLGTVGINVVPAGGG